MKKIKYMKKLIIILVVILSSFITNAQKVTTEKDLCGTWKKNNMIVHFGESPNGFAEGKIIYIDPNNNKKNSQWCRHILIQKDILLM